MKDDAGPSRDAAGGGNAAFPKRRSRLRKAPDQRLTVLFDANAPLTVLATCSGHAHCQPRAGPLLAMEKGGPLRARTARRVVTECTTQRHVAPTAKEYASANLARERELILRVRDRTLVRPVRQRRIPWIGEHPRETLIWR